MTDHAKPRILVVDDEEAIRKTVRVCLEGASYRVLLASSGEQAIAVAKKTPPDLMLVDLRLGGMDGIAVTKALRQEVPSAAVVLMTAYATIDSAVAAIRAGAADYLPKPFTPPSLLHTVTRVLEGARVRNELNELQRTTARGIHPRFETKSPAMKAVLQVAERIAPSDATVLLLGETGTGKSVLARHIHALSPRASRPFVTVNCAVIAETLIETELFGHAKGAFTGADAARAGHIEAAGTGTLFLDEVADLTRETQGKLLRLLEDHEYVRVGEVEPRRAEARVIAATHRDLKDAVTQQQFREDLFYRLNVVTLRLPSLRDRTEDIVDLASTMLVDLAAVSRKRPIGLADSTKAALVEHTWPGNLRELANVLERAALLAIGNEITPDLLPPELATRTAIPTHDSESLEAAERKHIANILAKYPKIETAAKVLGVDPSTLYRKRERYGLR